MFALYERRQDIEDPDHPKALLNERRNAREQRLLLRFLSLTSKAQAYTPPKLIVVEHARGKYRCEKAGEATIRIAQAVPSPLSKANASAGLLGW